jgi:hypothetical protein
MALIIDGYNLLHASGILGRGLGPGGLQRSRQALLDFLAESLDPHEVSRTIVVFDAAGGPRGLASRAQHRGLCVRYAAGKADADELIEELIREDTAPRSLVVVSSDHRLHRAARRRKAQAIDSDRWHSELLRQRRARLDPREPALRPSGPLSPYEVAFWLREFGAAGAEPPETSPPADPFPPGYADDLLEGQ